MGNRSEEPTKYPKYKGISLSPRKTFDLPPSLIKQLADEASVAERKFHSYVRWKLGQEVDFVAFALAKKSRKTT